MTENFPFDHRVLPMPPVTEVPPLHVLDARVGALAFPQDTLGADSGAPIEADSEENIREMYMHIEGSLALQGIIEKRIVHHTLTAQVDESGTITVVAHNGLLQRKTRYTFSQHPSTAEVSARYRNYTSNDEQGKEPLASQHRLSEKVLKTVLEVMDYYPKSV